MSYLLGIDIGTSGTKAVLFDYDGNTVASSQREYALYQPKNGWAQQKPTDWWNAVCGCVKSIVKDAGIDSANIKGIGLSGQMHGLVMLDKDDNVLRPAIIWCDQRTDKECAEITEKVGKERLIEITANPALTGFTASKIMWVKNNEPRIYEKCAKILLPKDYIRFMLTGEFATEVSDASGMQLLDVPNRKWSEEVLCKLEIDKELLGKVYESYEISGVVSSKAADLTGLKAGTPVAGGAGDQAAGAVGNGIVRQGVISATLGTSGVVFAHTDNVVIDKEGRVHTFCHAVPGAWHIMGVTQGAGLSLKWFRDNFCDMEKAKADLSNIDPYVLLDNEAKSVPIGSNGVIYLPYLMGERTPHLDPDARGVFFGLSAVNTKFDLLRSVMEGVSFSLKDCLEIILNMGIEATQIRASGGGGKSEFWRQMLSDVFSCDIATVNSSEGGALGVALLAGVGTGVYKSVPEACNAVIKIKSEQKPISQNTVVYNRYYDIYKRLYIDLKDSFNKIAQIRNEE